MPKLLFTIGPPRSGKSTYCTNWAKEAPNRAIVCADSIREALGFEFRQENETLIQGMKDTMIRALLNRGQDVIVDVTHSTIGNIKRLFAIDSKAKAIWIPSYEIYNVKKTRYDGYWPNIDSKKFNRRNRLLKRLIARGEKTKGNYIVEVIERIYGNITNLVSYGENLKELRNVT